MVLDRFHMTQTPRDDSDSALVAASISGCEESFRKLYQRYVVRVRSTLARLTDLSHIDDMTQEVFVNIWRNLASLRSTETFSSWVYRIAVNVALDHLKQGKRKSTEALNEEPPAEKDEASAIEAKQIVRAGLDKLNFQHRSVLVLHDMEQLTEKEISEILGIPQGTVKSRLFNARARMRTFLHENGAKL